MDLHRTSLLQGFANGACLCLAFASQLHGTRDGDGTLCCSLSAGTGLDTASLRLPRCTWSLEYQYIGSRRFHSSRDRRGRVRLLSFLGSWACPLKGLPSCWHPTEPVPAESSPELQKRDALNNCGPLRGCTKLRSAAVAAAALPFAPSWPCLALPGPAWPCLALPGLLLLLLQRLSALPFLRDCTYRVATCGNAAHLLRGLGCFFGFGFRFVLLRLQPKICRDPLDSRSISRLELRQFVFQLLNPLLQRGDLGFVGLGRTCDGAVSTTGVAVLPSLALPAT